MLCAGYHWQLINMTESLTASSRWIAEQLNETCACQQVTLGGETWHYADLLCLLESTALTAPTLAQGLEIWCEGFALLGFAWYPQLSCNGAEFSIRFKPLQVDAAMAPLWWVLLSWQSSLQRVLPEISGRLEWPHRPPTLTMPADLPVWPVHYTSQPGIHLSHIPPWTQATGMGMPLHGPLVTMLHRLHKLGAQPRGLLETLKQQIDQAFPQRLGLAELAANLHIPVCSLQRQLQQHKTSYSRLLEEVRCNRAISLLCHDRYSTQQVGLHLGYLDAPSFQRAFRQWFGLTPGQFRQRYLHRTPQPEQWPAVSLYYAINELQRTSLHQFGGARVWICLRNLSFDKSVQVLCEDHDGIWRPYTATFERFLNDELEIWSTSSLPVHDPVRFRIEYRVKGEQYVDNNAGLGYVLSTPVLLGMQEAVCHQLLSHLDAAGHPVLLVTLFSRTAWPQAVARWQVNEQWHEQRLFSQRCGEAWMWRGTLPISRTDQRIHFCFSDEERLSFWLDNNGEGYAARALG